MIELPRKQPPLSSKKLIAITCAANATTVFGVNLRGRVFAWGSGPLGLGEQQYYSQSPYQLTALRAIDIVQVSCSK